MVHFSLARLILRFGRNPRNLVQVPVDLATFFPDLVPAIYCFEVFLFRVAGEHLLRVAVFIFITLLFSFCELSHNIPDLPHGIRLK